MAELHALSGLLEQLRGYDEGARLKAAAMKEVVEVIAYLGLSRRAFVRRAEQLSVPIPSVTSLGNWIGCHHIPSADNVDRLIEALETVLRDHGENGEPWRAPLRESSLLNDHSLAHFRRDAANLEQAKGMLETTVAWLDRSDFPPGLGAWSASFLPMTREHGIRRLQILAQVHFDAAEKTTTARGVEHELLASKAAITLAHWLTVCGRYTEAWEAADEGGHVLMSILDKHPEWREWPFLEHEAARVLGETYTLLDLALLAITRKANALHGLSYTAGAATARTAYTGMMQRTLAQADVQAKRMPYDSSVLPHLWRTHAVMTLDNAERPQEIRVAAEHARCAHDYSQKYIGHSSIRAVLNHLALLTECEAASRLGKLSEASRCLTAADEVKQLLVQRWKLSLGSGHQVIELRTVANYWLAHANTQTSDTPRRREYIRRWRDATATAFKLTHESGAYNLERRLHLMVHKTAPEFQRLLRENGI